MILFPKDTVHIYQNSKTGGIDSYGKPLTCSQRIFTVPGDLQPLSPSESRYVFGDINTNTYRLYLNPDTQIKQDHLISIEGYTGFFKIIGTPQIYNTLVPHVEVLLQKIDNKR